MNKQAELKDILDLFKESVTPEEVIKAMLDAKISSDIVRIRLAKGLSQKDFADQAGVSQGLVSRWESGTMNYTIATLAKIAAAFDLNVHISISDPKATPMSVADFSKYKLGKTIFQTQKYTNNNCYSYPAKEG